MIRKIQSEDLPVCAAILKDAYSRLPYGESFVGDNADKYVLEKFQSCQADSFVFVSEDQRVVGFILMKISAWSEGPQGIIEEIVVNPANQHAGIGQALMRQAFDYFNSHGVKSVMIWAKNDERLLGFYKKHGFNKADDYVVMFKTM